MDNTLIYIHVFKNGGTSIMDLLYQINKKINTKAIFLKSKGPLNIMECLMKYDKYRGEKVSTFYSMKQLKKIDIIGGHMNFKLPNDLILNKPKLYICSFRCPYTRYISGHLYTNESLKLTEEQSIKAIKEKIIAHFKHKRYFNIYNKYLNHNFSVSNKNTFKETVAVEANEQLKQTISMFEIVIILEEWTQSLKNLEKVLNDNTPDTIEIKDIDKIKSTSVNKGRLSTNNIVDILKKDKPFWEKYTHVLKYEKEIYDFAYDKFKKHNDNN
jgi:hypothetical protein